MTSTTGRNPDIYADYLARMEEARKFINEPGITKQQRELRKMQAHGYLYSMGPMKLREAFKEKK